jgi:hypothetical protein
MSTETRDSTERSDAYEDEFRLRVRPWWVPWLVALVVAALVIGVGSYFAYGRETTVASMDMGGDEHDVPPVIGLYEGGEIRFIHTEASDPQIAGMLTEMMGSPVVVVRTLSEVPDSALGDVFVFANGVTSDDEMERGPFGFQPDVFDTVPGDPGYSPLRAVNVVTWHDESEPRVLRSVEDIQEARAAAELSIEQLDAVVNMPIVEWPGGER